MFQRTRPAAPYIDPRLAQPNQYQPDSPATEMNFEPLPDEEPLLDEDDSLAEVDEEDFTQFYNRAMPHDQDGQDDQGEATDGDTHDKQSGDDQDVDEDYELVAELLDTDAELLDTDAEKFGDKSYESYDETGLTFIRTYAQCNTVRNWSFAKAWTDYDGQTNFDSTIAPYCVRGNSRGDPTPYYFTCPTSGCLYKSLDVEMFKKHNTTCHETKAAAKYARDKKRAKLLESLEPPDPRRCLVSICDYMYTGKSSNIAKQMEKHFHDHHDWTPQKCDPGSESKRLFESRQAYV